MNLFLQDDVAGHTQSVVVQVGAGRERQQFRYMNVDGELLWRQVLQQFHIAVWRNTERNKSAECKENLRCIIIQIIFTIRRNA